MRLVASGNQRPAHLGCVFALAEQNFAALKERATQNFVLQNFIILPVVKGFHHFFLFELVPSSLGLLTNEVTQIAFRCCLYSCY